MQVIRVLLILARPFALLTKRRPVILLCDRKNAAGDNAESLYRFISTQNKNIDVYYVIKKKCHDWDRLKPEFNLVNCDSLRYHWLFLKADIICCSYQLIIPHGAWNYKSRHYKLIWLQHGIIHEDLSNMYNAQCGHNLVTVATKDEYKDRLRPEYKYSDNQVALTGLARYDLLQNNPQKIITIGLTWRCKLIYADRETFLKSTYYSIYEKLVIRSELMDLAERYGYQLQMVFHPEVNSAIRTCVEEKCDPRIRIIRDKMYKDIFAESSLLITDYSSLAFDMAYLKKPVIYYQQDSNEFYSGHTYKPGYFDFNRDGFGEVTDTQEGLLQIVEEYLLHECTMKDKYRERVENTFAYIDHNNCGRIWNEIEKRWLTNS